MNPQLAQNYLKTKVFTATPEQLQLMLYDGALRFGEQARVALEQKNYEQSYQSISRMQKIVIELTSALKPRMYPDLCAKLTSLYNYVYRKLVEANVRHTLTSLDEAIRLLRYQRETWLLLMGEMSRQKAATAAQAIDVPAPDARMEASLSVQG